MVVFEKYKCLNEACNAVFEDTTGPTTCRKCGSRYVEWTTFDKWDWDDEGILFRKFG